MKHLQNYFKLSSLTKNIKNLFEVAKHFNYLTIFTLKLMKVYMRKEKRIGENIKNRKFQFYQYYVSNLSLENNYFHNTLNLR